MNNDVSTKTIQDIIYDIHKRKSMYLFGYDADDNEFHYMDEDCVECIKKNAKECPFNHRDDSSESVKNPMRSVRCYMKYNKDFLKYLKQNDFVIAAPLFRVQNLENETISYEDDYWYPFRSGSAYLDLESMTEDFEETIDLSEDISLNELRWEITKQRDGVKTEAEIPFSIFKKVEKTKYSADEKAKYIDVCEGHASFMMTYFVISRRFRALENQSNKENKFYGKLKWCISDANDPLKDYLKKTKHNRLNLIHKGKKVYRESTWKEDLKFLGFVDDENKTTDKLKLFYTWLYNNRDEETNNVMIPYKEEFKNVVTLSLEEPRITIDQSKIAQINYSKKVKGDFTLDPSIHLIVRAFWETPVRWFFIPMTPKIDGRNIISISGLILMIKDEVDTDIYMRSKCTENINQKVKNLLPILTSIYAIEKQSLEDSINKKRINLSKKQKRASFHNAIAKVFLRTLSHNIGSHVLSRMVTTKDLNMLSLLLNSENYLDAPQNEQYRGVGLKDEDHSLTIFEEVRKALSKGREESNVLWVLYRKYLSTFNSYVQTRMEFLADIVTGPPLLQVSKFFIEEVIKPFDKNKYLLNRISGLSKDFKFKFKIELPDGVEDLRVSISNDLLGQHALYIILENIIRNTAKHSPPSETDDVCFTIKVEESHLDKSFYKVIVFDNVERKDKPVRYSLDTFKKNYKDEKNEKVKKILKWFKTYSEKNQNEKLIITETQKIALELNALIDSDIIDKDNFELREEGMGMIEMLVCAAYLRRIPSHKVQDDKYRLIFDNYRIEEFNKQVRKGENSLKIFRAIAYKKKHLGFQFYLPKPKDIFIIDKKEEFINTLDLEESKRKGIWIEPSVKQDDAILHDICLINDTFQDYKSSMNLPVRRISWNTVGKYHFANKNNRRKLYNESLILKVWSAYVSRLFEKKGLISGNSPDRLLIEKAYRKYAYSFDDHGKEFRGINFSKHHHIYGSQNNRIVHRIKKNFDFKNDNSVESEILIYKVLTASVTNVLILDERIQKQSESKISLSNNDDFGSITYHEFWNMINVYIPQEEEIDLNQKNYDTNYTKKIIKIIQKQFYEHEERVCKGIDFIVIHLGVIEKILIADHRSSKKKQEEVLDKVEEIKKEFDDVEIVITSGRGQPANLPNNIPFVSYSMLSQYLIKKRFKLYLSELLYAAKPINKNKNGR
ncbi:hypothetical protein [Flavivirga spongiicola]|uniref:Uncharacterized protein n=1 Tax=Flavivirga spongiicola TaxID=421621 RepID=A0ABU7Y1A0_9FLAO|nr:hypothetical protein [Flavivirga sp. MEBiC05379]MDO5980914.1 hypothetical protein [Flavivirga sp. MEBiC05379]